MHYRHSIVTMWYLKARRLYLDLAHAVTAKEIFKIFICLFFFLFSLRIKAFNGKQLSSMWVNAMAVHVEHKWC